jgi:anti-anti-sigma factor
MERLLGPVTILERAPGRFSITGEIDMATAQRLDELASVQGDLLLDLHGVTFIDSSGIAALVRLYKRCEHEDCTLLIEACSPQVERVLRVVDLFDIFTEGGTRDSSIGDGQRADPRPPAPEMEPEAATAPLRIVDIDADDRGKP